MSTAGVLTGGYCGCPAPREQVTLKSESKSEGEIWVEKLKQTAMWFNDRDRKAGGLRAGAGAPVPPRNDNPIVNAPTQVFGSVFMSSCVSHACYKL